MKPTLALSTSWNSHRHQDGAAMLQEIADLGFTHVELSHGVRITLVPGILKALHAGVIKVASTHNFCPLPIGIDRAAPNLYEPSSLDPRELDQWLRNTKRTLDFAGQVGARVCVLHLGSVNFLLFNPGPKLRKLSEGRPDFSAADPAYQALLRKSCEKLRKKMPRYWAQVKQSIKMVLSFAAEKGVKLGCENREKFEELPVDDDYAAFIAEFPPEAPIGYWHDTGHAQIKETAGLLHHETHLRANADRLLGFHLHDVDPEGHDHVPIGAGQIDFDMVSSFWRPHHLLTLELSPRVSPEDVAESKRRIEALIARMPE